jgi:hypothetical protein
MTDKLTTIEELSEILGFTDIRSIEKWCKSNRIPIITMGKRKYIVSTFINQYIENEMNSFVEAHFGNPKEIMQAIDNDDSLEIAKLMKAPVSKKVKKEYKEVKKRSSASENFLKTIKAA